MVFESPFYFSFDNRGLVLGSGASFTLVKNWGLLVGAGHVVL